jgi:trimeric autotransporter adhesin
MSTTGPRSQIPLNRAIVDQNGYLTVPWSFWFQSQNAGLAPAGTGYVIDGSAAQVTMTLFQGVDSQKGSAQNGYIFFALDTGKTYVSVGNQWVLQDPAYTGDVTKSQGSTVTSLANVFGSPGTYGASSQIPVLTIDSKGRVIGVSLVQATASAGGANNEVQFNNGGVISGTAGITYDGNNQAFVFSNPQPTLNNLSPLIAKGDIMVRDAANTTRQPVGTNGQVLTANSATSTGLEWANITVSGGFVPYYVANNTTFTVPLYYQALWAMNIELATQGYIEVDGYLIEVD